MHDAPAQIEARLKLSGAWDAAACELAEEAAAAQAAAQQGLAVADEELQRDFDEFRAARALHKAEDTWRWLKALGLTVEQVEDSLAARMLGSKLAAKLIGDTQIDTYYKKNPTEFEYARLSQIVVADKAVAEELALGLREEGDDFGKLARQRSLDKASAPGGGYIGLVTRQDTGGLPQTMADRIFAAKPGEVVGPIPSEDAYYILRVEEVGRRPLDGELRMALREELYGQWLAERSGSGNGSA